MPSRSRLLIVGRVIYLNGHVYSPEDPFATALVVDGATVGWVGQDGAALANAGADDEVIDVKGALIAPGFVDAHVHHSAAGLALTGLDLHEVTSREDLLSGIAASPDHMVMGQGWDETRWSDPRLPNRNDIDAAAGGRPVYLARVDAHSALISTALADLVPDVSTRHGYSDTALVADAHHAARIAAFEHVSIEQRIAAIRAFRAHAASRGVVAMHECSGPIIAGLADVAALAALAHEPGPEIVLYWGDSTSPVDIHVAGLAGDYFVDGSFGSRTALLTQDYTDAATRGEQYLQLETMISHIIECTRQGLQAGFHAIGDGAIDLTIEAFKQAADVLGVPAVRASRHRIEHVEFIRHEHIATMAQLGIVASVQPSFDAQWAGPKGMYEQRLGDRTALLNPFAAMSAAGVILAFGSDAPVLPVSPWEGVRAAAFTHNPQNRISVRAAFAAHTRGGHRAARDDLSGVLVSGAPAHFAVWEPTDLVVQAPDDRISAWSTDPRSGTPGLPDLQPGSPIPRCVRTVRDGVVIFDSGWLS